MRAHKCITELKESFHYDFRNITDEEIEYITNQIFIALKENRVCIPIIDIVNRLGFTIYNFPFKKEKCEDDVEAFFGIGTEFNVNENSNFFLIEKVLPTEDKRFLSAYLLAKYILEIDERTTDFYKFYCSRSDIKNTVSTRMALSILMPENIFKAQWEFISMAYKTSDRQPTISKTFLVKKMSKTFQVTEKMIQSRLLMLNM